MELNDIIEEAIDTNREHIRRALEDHKTEIQQAKTRLGVRRVLHRLFPEVEFKAFGSPKGGGLANWRAEDQKIRVGNQEGLVTAKVARNNWRLFVDNIVQLLTHEDIHRQQSERRGHRKEREYKDKLTRKEKAAARQEYLNKQEPYINTRSAESERALGKFVTKMKKKGMNFEPTRKQYLSNTDEITAHAEGIAADTVAAFKQQGADHEQAKRLALRALRTRPDQIEGLGYQGYREWFNKGDKTFKRLYKQIAQYIQQM